MTAVTLGAHDVPVLRDFYRTIGWQENDGSDDTFTSFTVGTVRLALFPIESLRREAAPDEPPVMSGGWSGITLALNVESRGEVDDAVACALEAGARPVGHPVEREWGGYSGYFADPEGNRWEVAWAPWLGRLE